MNGLKSLSLVKWEAFGVTGFCLVQPLLALIHEGTKLRIRESFKWHPCDRLRRASFGHRPAWLLGIVSWWGLNVARAWLLQRAASWQGLVCSAPAEAPPVDSVPSLVLHWACKPLPHCSLRLPPPGNVHLCSLPPSTQVSLASLKTSPWCSSPP